MENELNDFKDWLKKTGISARACNDVISRLRRIGKEYDVLDEYAKDKCVELLEKFTYTAQNRRNGEEPKVDIIIDGDYCSGISSLKSALNYFVDFLNDIHYCAVVKQSATHAFFYGTLQDFNKNIGPRCRNEVQLICKSERELQGGVCEYCGKQNCVLDSAHVVERPVIIKSILKRYEKKPDYYEVDLDDFFTTFKKAHMPIRDNIFFLCKECHNNLDKKKTITIDDIKRKRKDCAMN